MLAKNLISDYRIITIENTLEYLTLMRVIEYCWDWLLFIKSLFKVIKMDKMSDQELTDFVASLHK